MFLQIDGVSVRYGRDPMARAAVDGVSLGLAQGQIGVLIGPSGCGKTSLLRAVAGLEPCTAGRIGMNGNMLSDAAAGLHRAPEDRRIGMVFQDYALFPHLSVADNIAFGLRHRPRAERGPRVQEMLQLVGLPDAGGRAPHQLSGGQQQRIALARALAPQPQLLLLDEPFSSLDIDLRERLAQELRQILKAAHTTALFVTHDQLEAFALADQIGVMHRGRLEQWGDAPTLYQRPASRFVAQFIGHGVLTPARAAAPGGTANGRRQLQTPLGELSAAADCLPLESDSAPAGTGTHGDTECDLLLRADDIVFDAASPVRACVERKAFRGAAFLYTLRLTGGEQVLALWPTRLDHPLGAWIGIRAQPDCLVTFPRNGN